MRERFGRFTQPARRVLQLANDEAERLKHLTIGTEHVLIGLVQEEQGIGGQVLRAEGVTFERVVEIVEQMTEPASRISGGKPNLTPGTKQVLEYALEEARKLNHTYVGTEHLLLGLIRQSDGVAIDVLRQMDLTSDRIRRHVLQILSAEEERASQWQQQTVPPVVDNVRYIYAILSSDATEMVEELAHYAEYLSWKASRKNKPK